jgi:hypothetical protein
LYWCGPESLLQFFKTGLAFLGPVEVLILLKQLHHWFGYLRKNLYEPLLVTSQSKETLNFYGIR